MAKRISTRQLMRRTTLTDGEQPVGTSLNSIISLMNPQPFGQPNRDRPLPKPLRSDLNLTEFGRNIALIEMTAPFKRPQYGQGIFLSRNFILTAAHIADFYARNRTVKIKHYKNIGKPVQTAIALRTYIHYGYSENDQATETDLGLIELYIPENKNRISLIPTPPPPHDLQILAFWGPGWFSLKRFTEQYISKGIRLDNRHSSNSLISGQHDAPTLGKWSGAPIMVFQGTDLKLIGIHSAYIPNISNTFCGFNQEICDDLNSIIQSGNIDTIRWSRIWQDENLLSSQSAFS